MRRHHELPFGAELVPDGARFRLWAPRTKSVSLVLEGSGQSPHPNPPPLAGEGANRSADRSLPGPLSNPPPQAGEGRVGAAILRMRAEAEGWWSVTTGRAGAGSRYRYRVDGAEVP